MERTILLVDDEEDIGAALARLLRRDGYRILRAKSGPEGLALMKENEVGVVVSDQRMPEMTGVEFLTQVKELYPNTVRIVLSGYADLDAVTDAINRGAIYKYFNKPWDNEVLCSEVLGAFRHHELILEKEQLLQDIQVANEMLEQANEQWVAAVVQRDTQIKQISQYDALTGLPNRVLFLDRLGQELARALRDGYLVAVMFVDLDRFKQVNDSFGQPVGDQLLQKVAERLAGHVRVGDTLAHMEGDEFSLVLAGIKDPDEAGETAQKILDALSHDTFSLGGEEIYVTASIGIGVYPNDGTDASTLIKNAAAALYHAKSERRGNFQYYASEMNASAGQRLKLETDLRGALNREEFVLHYQPKVDLTNGKIIGMEVLLRWQSPERGLILPLEIIPLLEETGLILPVGEWVLGEACKQARAWQQLGLPAIRIAVNLSAAQFRQADLAGTILKIFKENGMDPGQGILELELTESLLMKNVDATIATLKKLHDVGVQFSIDDFGTGYSSLSYLKRFPINTLKIDKSFVDDITTNDDDAAIVSAIIALGYSLGLNVIAEGVETVEQLKYLRRMKCNEMQGYLFSRPVPAEEMTNMLQSGKSMELPWQP
ncbi:MAG: diguanylate cyclase [Gallionellales bacterium RBG_16_57_15]|nr:MAG: diguanylate cyclase [Gallionellales bacterium RBG_16_57_15]